MPFDVLINGGGIAGPCLAYWLTRHGHTVTIVEQARQLRTGGQAVDFRGPALTVLEKMGLLDQVRAGATRMGPLVLVDDRGKEVGRLPAEVVSGEVEMHWGDFARILYEAVRNDVNYRFGVRVTAIDDNAQGVGVTFSDASTGTYDLVIGADGLHSGTRRLVFGPEGEYVTQLGQCFGFFDIENSLRLDHCGMAHIDAGRTAALQGIDPDKPARASFFLADPHLRFDYRNAEGNKRLFAERYAGMGWQVPNLLHGLAEAPEVYFDSIAQVHLSSYARGRVCLTGDAAWCASPRSGMGTTLAIVGSYVLAHEMRAAGEDHAAAFARYQRLLEPYVARCQKLAINALKTERVTSGRLAPLRNATLRLLRIPAISKLVARQALSVARSFSLPDY
ncbi:FAD-dependent monooxygenase [Mycobacterium sp. 94-17]|uniref:FAD-dependent monooxygenase n=1 Tax=Mycobacterium sp. 94-17 TaxID=2986147 RepID=UPI002D1F66D4|nr:FAD-dependent monooxygenase [Mycobacterium sp. 94-17]MEB4208143.1 FAD-dependent oxidoreductase [Mycobacterium sp. 94-17]